MKIHKVFHELEITDVKTDKRSITLLKKEKPKPYDSCKKYLNMYASLMASSPGVFCKDLKSNDAEIHRFEWQFGVTAPPVKDPVFDWVGALRDDRSICIQVIIGTPGPGYECIVTQADMNGFKPLNTLKDDSTNYFSLIGSMVGDISPIPAFSKIMGRLTGHADKRDAARYANRFKNMFRLFRFLTDKGEQGFEYILTKDVIAQWGTFFKGSFGICFIRNASTAKSASYRIKLLPALGFKEGDHLCYLPRPDQAIKAELAIEVAA